MRWHSAVTRHALPSRSNTTRKSALPVLTIHADPLHTRPTGAHRDHHAIADVDPDVRNALGRCCPDKEHEVTRGKLAKRADPLPWCIVL